MSVYVTGIGIVSALGSNLAANRQAISEERTGVRFSEPEGLMLGAVQMSNDELIRLLDLPNGDYSRSSLLGLMAAREAWGNRRNADGIRTGMVGGTSIGGLDRTEYYYKRSGYEGASDAYNRMTFDNGKTTEVIAGELGISGFIGTISTACSSGANAIMHGARLIEGNQLDCVLTGGSDPMARFMQAGFSSLNLCDQGHCKPFDESRKGLNLGEGAAFLVLENEKSMAATGTKPLCTLSGWNNASDAFHQTASSADGVGAIITMRKALAKAGLTPKDISYINAHGTGTGNNDLSESMALKSVFADVVPPFSSSKGFTGHTLAAAGAIEAVFCVLSILEQALLPNLHFSEPMKETGLKPVTRYSANHTIRHVLSNSFGFGGNCTTLIFSKI